MSEDPTKRAATAKPRLLLLFAPADHPHRDPVCGTLAWVAREEGSLFECYYDSPRSGVHHGGGHPAYASAADLRGGTFTGGRHLEQFYLLLSLFDCQAVVLGTVSSFDVPLAAAGVPVRARSAHVAGFYRELFATSKVAWPNELLLIGDGGRPQGVALTAYAFPEVVGRQMLAIAAGDPEALASLSSGRHVEQLWNPGAPDPGGAAIAAPPDRSVARQTAWMADRWHESSRGFLLGDPELVGRWTPAAVRQGWLPLFGIPQTDVIAGQRERLASEQVVYGRQQDDRDFLELSRAGVAFQLIDPGRPPFPVVAAAPSRLQLRPVTDEPTDDDLESWASKGRVLATLLFWTGMVRELENLYSLADALSLSGLAAGLVLTTASFDYCPQPPLTLAYVPRELGGLAPRVEILLASGGSGAFLESATPPERFAETLRSSVEHLREILGNDDLLPRGWWGTMDAPLVPRARPPRLTRQPEPPYVRIRYRGRGGGQATWPEGRAATPTARRRDLRRLVRDGPAGRLFEALRPFDGYLPGPPGRTVLEAVRDAGFEYAFTKSAFAEAPGVVSGVPGLTAINYTVGRWDGWTPFATVNTLGDLVEAERRLLRRGAPGWLAGTLDTCLWAFSGPIWERAGRLRAICDWVAAGGRSGRLVNVTPRTVARYAKLLARTGRVKELPAE